MTEAAFIYDETHLLTALARTRRQTRGIRVLLFVKIVAGLLFCAMAAVLMAAGRVGVSLTLLAPVPILVFAHRLDEPSIRRRFRKSPFCNAPVSRRFSEARIEINDGKVDARLEW